MKRRYVCQYALQRYGLYVNKNSSIEEDSTMAWMCTICGKHPSVGNNVSHANNRTKRRWMPNLQRVKVKTDDGPKRIRVCTNCIRSGRIQKAA